MKENRGPHYEEMKKATNLAVKELKRKTGDKSTVIILVADDTGAWICDWNWHHPVVAVGLAKLGVDSITQALRDAASQAEMTPPDPASGFKSI